MRQKTRFHVYPFSLVLVLKVRHGSPSVHVATFKRDDVRAVVSELCARNVHRNRKCRSDLGPLVTG